MLLRFAVSNHLSIFNEQTLLMVPSSLRADTKKQVDLISYLEARKDAERQYALPGAIIYGPNASGKSNLVAALYWMRSAVRSSHRRWDPDGGVPRDPFKLAKEAERTPSVYELDFLHEGIRYNFGFTVDSERVLKEHLFSWPEGRQRKLYERDGDQFNFSDTLKGPNKSVEKVTRSNSLFLSAAAQNNHDYLSHVYAYFGKILFAPDSIPGQQILVRGLGDSEQISATLNFIRGLGTGIIDARIIERDTGDEEVQLLQKISEAINITDERDRKKLLESLKKEIWFRHRGVSGYSAELSFHEESAGTRRLFALAVAATQAIKNGGVFLVDEIDASLHTKACEHIYKIFQSKRTNPKGAQIIATTHDTNLLVSDSVRRDQVWFTEKSFEGETIVYPLSDFKTRLQHNIEKGYLEGRFGALPHIVMDLAFGEENEESGSGEEDEDFSAEAKP